MQGMTDMSYHNSYIYDLFLTHRSLTFSFAFFYQDPDHHHLLMNHHLYHHYRQKIDLSLLAINYVITYGEQRVNPLSLVKIKKVKVVLSQKWRLLVSLLFLH